MRLAELSKSPDDILLHEEVMNLWEMANLRPKETGVNGVVIWVSSGEAVQHGPRIKVVRGLKWKQKESATIPLTGMPRVIGDIGLTQDEFANIVEWIRLNYDALMQYWNSEISTGDLFSLLKRIDQ